MDLGIISVRYARALLRFATENKEDDRVYAETEKLAQAFLKVPDLQHALTNPVVGDKQKLQLLRSAIGGAQASSTSLSRFLDLLVRKGRTDLVMYIAHSYGTLYRRTKRLIKGRLIVPSPVSETVIDHLKQMVESTSKESVEFGIEQDPAIIGGFILEYGTYRLDASVRAQLATLKRELTR